MVALYKLMPTYTTKYSVMDCTGYTDKNCKKSHNFMTLPTKIYTIDLSIIAKHSAM